MQIFDSKKKMAIYFYFVQLMHALTNAMNSG